MGNFFAYLPPDVVKILNNLHRSAISLEQSFCASRRERGELLKQFIFNLHCQSGNLQEIEAFIKAFTQDTENMKITKRNSSFFDFFACKKTTYPEDYISELSRLVAENMKHKQLVIGFNIHPSRVRAAKTRDFEAQ
ncbi:hypothetical protein [Legionella sp. PC997]|uniref:hypothetical protein n=1 Tax=Legionella sp. PC997 TaxID=2755562 RepID=UPI0015FBD29B|nr:hypothetical protein [Legionella sp. PC997]QMT61132.1 hypothetical protein HBNCFIEN_02522 [Legionella sp. PC997]